MKHANSMTFMTFIDLIKAFDSITHQAAWSMLSRYDCLNIYIRILMLVHDGMSVTVLSNSSSESAMFAIFITAISHPIGEELPKGIPILYRTDGRL